MPPLKQLIYAYMQSLDLEAQQKKFGTCLRKPLPLRETLRFENYFMDDIMQSPIYQPFADFVGTIQKSADHKDLQSLFLGVMVQLSGYGKTHLARVYTRHNRALYFKLGNKTQSSPFIGAITAQITKLKAKIMPNGLDSATANQYKELTRQSQCVVEIFFLVAIKHYAICYQQLLNMEYDIETATAICSQVFDNGCGQYFKESLKTAWEQLDNERWIEDLYKEVEIYVKKHNIKAIFCDEVHSLQRVLVGEFSHTATPASDPDWPESLIPERALYERHLNDHKFKPDSISQRVKDAYDRCTSLTYLIVTVLETISLKTTLASVMMTTDEHAITFVEGSPASRDRARIMQFQEFERPVEAEATRQNELLKEYFGIDFYGYLKATNPEYSKIMESFGSRAVYFKQLLDSVVDILEKRKPSPEAIQGELGNIWKMTHNACLIQANQFVELLMANKEYYIDVVYGALFHNGHLQNIYGESQRKINSAFVPCVVEPVLGDDPKYRISDWWVLQSITSSKAPVYIQTLMRIHDVAPNLGIQGEDLLKLVLMQTSGKKIADLAVKELQFHKDSPVYKFLINVTACGNISEFNMSPLELLEDPLNKLKQRFIKMTDIVKPDGLALLEHGTTKQYMISAFQSKNWSKRLNATQVEEALKSLDPELFFSAKSRARKQWEKKRNPEHWQKYIRVIWAQGFSLGAIDYVNNYNLDKANIDLPVVLMAFDQVPQELQPKGIIQKKPQRSRKTKNQPNFKLSAAKKSAKPRAKRSTTKK